jgi:hypothetical protein
VSHELVKKTFRYPSGRPASGVTVQIFHRGQTTELARTTTNSAGEATWYLAPGEYDFLAAGVRVPVSTSHNDAPAASLEEHITDLTPHPAYDDIPSLVLLFENGLV